MGDIKYRIWLENEEFMGEVVQLTMIKDNVVEIKAKDTINGGWYYVYEDSKFILMQYTGLKDINGVEIYEGDIINAHWFYPKLAPETLGMSEGEINLSRLEVMEMRGMLGFYFEDEFMPLGFVPAHEESFEVIGNIYENPELLEVD